MLLLFRQASNLEKNLLIKQRTFSSLSKKHSLKGFPYCGRINDQNTLVFRKCCYHTPFFHFLSYSKEGTPTFTKQHDETNSSTSAQQGPNNTVINNMVEWTKEDVQAWFLRSDDFKAFASHFPLSGKHLAGLSEITIKETVGNPAMGEALFNAIQELKKADEAPDPKDITNLDQFERFIAKAKLEPVLPHTLDFYDNLNHPPNVQKDVLGSLYKRPWPIVTPLSIADDTSKVFDFLYSDTQIGKEAVEYVTELIGGRLLRIFVNMGLSGAGKSHLIRQLAVLGKANVLLYDCGANAIPLRESIKTAPDGPLDLTFYLGYADRLKFQFLKFTLANAYTYLYLVRKYKTTPVQFLRFLENGGAQTVARIFDALVVQFPDSPLLTSLKTSCIEEILRLTNLPVVEAWDEAGELTKWAADMIPFTKHPANPVSRYDPQSRQLIDGGSALTIATRLATSTAAHCTIITGTALRLTNLERHISSAMKSLVKYSTDELFKKHNVLRMWSPATVIRSFQEDLQLPEPPSKEASEEIVSEKIFNFPLKLETVTYLLQGQARLTSVFKQNLFLVMREDPSADLDSIFEQALQLTENHAIRDFRDSIEKYHKGAKPTSTHVERAKQRLEYMKELVIKGYISFKDATDDHDLVQHGLVHIKEYEQGRVQYYPLEPLMYRAMYHYLDSEGINFRDPLIEWMERLKKDRYSEDARVRQMAESQKGSAAEVFLAQMLVWASKDLNGKPITDHPLFSEFRGQTYLDDYTMKFESFQYNSDELWKVIMREQRTDIFILPPQKMRPDGFGFLDCIPATPSYQKFGEHRIPITTGCKLFQQALWRDYVDNYSATVFENAFSKHGKHVIEGAEQQRRDFLELHKTLPVKRGLQIGFLYTPFSNEETRDLLNYALTLKPKCDNEVINKCSLDVIYVTFDFHHQAFEDTLVKYSAEAQTLLHELTKPKKAQ